MMKLIRMCFNLSVFKRKPCFFSSFSIVSKRKRCFFLLFSLLFFSTGLALSARLVSQSYSVQKAIWSYHFQFDQQVPYRTFLLKKPDRYMIEFRHVPQWNFKEEQLSVTSPVSRIRYQYLQPDGLRLVLDLRRHVDQKQITAAYRQAASDVFCVTIGADKKNIQHHQNQLNKGVAGSFSGKSSLAGDHKNIKEHVGKPSSSSTAHTIKASNTPHSAAISTQKNSIKARDLVIVIDPGHGGKDPGTTGKDNTHEKDIVLSISKKIKKDLDEKKGVATVLTRKGDYYLKLRQRLDIARHHHPDLFVAIHADGWFDQHAHGVSVFALSSHGATSEAARWLAKQENQSELLGGVNLNDKSEVLRSVLIELSQNATIGSSIKVGNTIIDKIKKVAPLHQRHVEQAAFVVLKSPDIPSLLIEVGFLSNLREEARLKNHDYQKNTC